MKKNIDRNGLEYKYVDLDQYDTYEPADMGKVKELSQQIGAVIVFSSELEFSVESAIAALFSDRSDEMGMTVVKFLEYSQKVALFTEMTTSYISWSSQALPDRCRDELKQISKELMVMAELRNIVAHAKWMSLDGDGFVRSWVKVDKKSGLPIIKYYKLDDDALNIISKRLRDTDDLLVQYIENIHLR